MSEAYEVRFAGIEPYSINLAPKPEEFSGKVFNFDLATENKINFDKSAILTKVSINIKDEDKPEILGQCSVVYVFEVKNLEDIIVYNKDNDYYIIPEDLEFHLRIVSLSTTRGILYSTFKGTYLHGATLPIIGNLPKMTKVTGEG